jgi:hypothetical protein
LTGKSLSINGINVPPPPPDDVNSSLIGIDTNANEIRDDVDRLIASLYGENAIEYAGAVNYAKQIQRILAWDANQSMELSALINSRNAELRCLAQRYFAGDIQRALQVSSTIASLTINTTGRNEAYHARLSTQSSVTTIDIQQGCS